MRELVVFVALLFSFAYSQTLGGQTDDHGCMTSAGYTWCPTENACVRPWELLHQKGLANSEDAFRTYCSTPAQVVAPIGGDRDANGCIPSAGYTWCAVEKSCVRPWELAKQKNLDGSKASFDAYCSGTTLRQIGSDTDDHGCLISAGYSWCETEKSCVRPWELARAKGLDGSKATYDAYCSGASVKIGGNQDANGCLIGAGYTWCQFENKCVRPWELSKQKNLDGTKGAFTRYCTSGQTYLPGSVDANGCHRGTGYTWCATENKCVRPWELSKEKNLDGTKASFDAYCANSNSNIIPVVVGGDTDEHGCVIAAGYTWCAAEAQCVRPWELARQKNLDGTKVSFDAYCSSSTPIGGDMDEHNCLTGAGYTWCQAENQCVRPWELARAKGLDLSVQTFKSYCAGAVTTPIGGDMDEHGCIAGAGYTWCQTENQCVRPWELARQKNLGNSADAFVNYCSGVVKAPIGGDNDEHGCITGAGYTWCAAENQCVRLWELANQKGIALGDAQSYCA